MMPKLWFLDVSPLALDRWLKLLRYRRFGVANSRDILVAEVHHQDRTRALCSEDVPVPEDFPVPRLALPKRGFAPDYLSFQGLRFCSQRFREAMAQPETVVQWTEVATVYGGPEVLRQDYQLLRILAHQPAMDLQRSDCTLRHLTNRLTGAAMLWPSYIRRFVFVPNFVPETEILRVEESPSHVLVTDALAERVLRAGCTGMEFIDPDSPQAGRRIERYRTATGIAERRVHF